MLPNTEEDLSKKYLEIFKLNFDPTGVQYTGGVIQVGPGWHRIIAGLADRIYDQNLNLDQSTRLIFHKISSNHGYLSFSYQGGTPYLDGMMDAAEALSELICEDCGEITDYRPGICIHCYSNRNNRVKIKIK